MLRNWRESCSRESRYLCRDVSEEFFCRSNIIKGCKQWHLGKSGRNKYKNKFDLIINSIPINSDVLLSFGEIDCRIDEGIMNKNRKNSELKITDLILDTVKNYLSYVDEKLSSFSLNVTIQGVPCPNIDVEMMGSNEIFELVNLIKEFNIVLQMESISRGYGFLDVHSITDRGDGFSNRKWHIDQYHLSPDGIVYAWREKASLKNSSAALAERQLSS